MPQSKNPYILNFNFHRLRAISSIPQASSGIPSSICICSDDQLEDLLDDNSVDVDDFAKVALKNDTLLEDLFHRGKLFEKLASKLAEEAVKPEEKLKEEVDQVLQMADVVISESLRR